MSDWGASRLTSRQALSYSHILNGKWSIQCLETTSGKKKNSVPRDMPQKEWNNWGERVLDGSPMKLDGSTSNVLKFMFLVSACKDKNVLLQKKHVAPRPPNLPNWLSDSSSLIVMVSRWILKTSLQRLRNIPKGFSDNLTFAHSRSDYDVKSCLPTRRWYGWWWWCWSRCWCW